MLPFFSSHVIHGHILICQDPLLQWPIVLVFSRSQSWLVIYDRSQAHPGVYERVEIMKLVSGLQIIDLYCFIITFFAFIPFYRLFVFSLLVNIENIASVRYSNIKQMPWLIWFLIFFFVFFVHQVHPSMGFQLTRA